MIDIRTLPDVTRGLGRSQLRLVEEHISDELVRLKENPLTYGHPPHEGQERLVMSERRRKLLICANRWGKTEIAMRETLWRARGDHPYRSIRPHEVIWAGMPDYPSYLRFTKPAFDKWCPPGWIYGQFNNTDKYVDIRRADGGLCRISFLSYDMPRTKWQGAGVDFLWLDEEPPEDLFGEAMARTVTTRGDALLTFTPVEGMGWWYDRLLLPALAGENGWDVHQGALATRDPSVLPDELEVGEPLVPHMSRADVIDFARLYPDEVERSIRIFGQVLGRAGTIYKGYARAIHLTPRFPIPKHWELWGATDPGYHGFAVVFFAVSPSGRIFIVHEFYSQAQPTGNRFDALAKIVRKLRGLPEQPPEQDEDAEPEPPIEPVAVFVDTEDPQTTLELNIEAAGSRAPLVFVSLDQGLKAVKAGILRIQQLLAPRTERETPEQVIRPRPLEGEPLLYIFDDLHSEWRDGDRSYHESRLLWEIQRYLWKKPPKGSSVPPDEPDKHSAGGAHMLDAMRYGVMSRVGPSPEEEKEKYDTADAWAWEMVDELEEQLLAEREGAWR